MLKNIVQKINHNVKTDGLVYSKPFVMSMLLSESDKTCLNMARTTLMSHDILQRILSSGANTIEELKSFLLSLALQYCNKPFAGYLIVDDTALVKQFAKVFEGLSFVHDSASSKVANGYKIVLICWTNKIVTIPINFQFWLPEEITMNQFKTKLEIAKQMIDELKNKIDFLAVLLDGLYASDDMMSFFEANGNVYYMRLPRNRRVRGEKDSIAFSIGSNISFKLKKNFRQRTFVAFFGEIKRFVTAQKRKKRNGDYETVYIVSNHENKPEITIEIYSIRWTIEKVIRTLKQIMGLNDCKARTLERQAVHIFSCMAGYGILEQIKYNHNLECPEDAHKYLLDVKRNALKCRNFDLVNIFN